MKSTRHYLELFLITAVLLAFVSGRAYATCASAGELNAHNMRLLQTHLMVGALQCRGHRDLGHRPLYNQFVSAHSAELKDHGNILIQYFKRLYGPSHTARLDHYVTRLANHISAESRKNLGFCQDVAELAPVLKTTEPLDLSEIAESLPIDHPDDLDLCPTGHKRAAISAK